MTPSSRSRLRFGHPLERVELQERIHGLTLEDSGPAAPRCLSPSAAIFTCIGT